MRGGLGIGGEVTSPPSQNSPYGGHMSQNLHWNTQFLRFYKNHYIIVGLDSERAGSRTLEKFSRRDRDQDCAKFESSRRFRGSNMNPKKKSRRCRASVSIQALDLAISRFIHSLVPDGPTFKPVQAGRGTVHLKCKSFFSEFNCRSKYLRLGEGDCD
jgi:hypothetical protein